MRRLSLTCLLFMAVVWGSLTTAVAQSASSEEVYVVEIAGPVNQAMTSFFARAVREAEAADVAALLIVLDTPGGAVDATLDIVQLFRNSTVPVIVYIAPAGAQAASAGSVITAAAHASAMAPETVIGAASPVGGGGEDIQETLYRKAVEDLKAVMRSLTERRGEAATALAEQMIEEARAVTAREALEVGYIDVIARDTDDLLQQLDGLEVTLGEETQVLHTAAALQTEFAPNGVEQFLYGLASILMNPLFISALIGLGVQAIIFEFSNPGGWVAGFIGFICIGLALYGLGQLPANFLGLVLILAAFILFVLEVFTPTFGALTVTGAITLLAGLLVLFNSPGTPQFARLSISGAIAITSVTVSFFVYMVIKVIRAQQRQAMTGQEGLVGRTGRVRHPITPGQEGTVFVYGALWQAAADEAIESGEKVAVKGVDGLTLRVKKLN